MPVLRYLSEMAADGCLVKPLFYQWVMDPATVISLNLMVDRPVPRQPDGWFHASQHPLMPEKELYAWITGRVIPEEISYVGRMSLMFGSLSHAVIESLMDWMGVAVPFTPDDCPACGKPRRPVRSRPSRKYCTEHGFVHEATRARCHVDGVLDFGEGFWRGFDFKSIRSLGLSKAPDMNPEFFREKWPHYWAQMQECMRLSGLREYIVFFLTMGNPWDTREYHISFDPEFARATEEKYLTVLSHAERKVPIVA